MTSVAILGGGVAGLTAAHELAERGYDVNVYEMRTGEFGGKARSMPVPDFQVGGRDPLPAEHGFRFFPGFYRHVPDTLARIPYPGGGSVADHLVATREVLLAQAGGRNEFVTTANAPSSFDDLALMIKFQWNIVKDSGVRAQEFAKFFQRMLTLLVSCDERRTEQWDRLSWWEFTDAEQASIGFQKFLADGMTRTLVAARAREMSARTGGLILWQLIFDLAGAEGRKFRVLDGPTSEVWINPWLAHLRESGAVLRDGCEVAGIECDGRRVTGVTIETQTGREQVVADHYLSALPVERLRLLLSPALRAAEPRLAALPRLVVRWMNGAMFYLDRDVPLVPGHALFIDSEWALTAISQAQFWRGVDLPRRGDGRVEGILSVDISEWDRPGRRTGKVAMACSKEEIREEVWGQLMDHIDDGSLDENNVVTWFLDSAIRFPNPTSVTNLEPLLVNTAGSWGDRPDAVTQIPNFFLAADFVRTFTDLATMEGANEAARRAVNGILDATDSSAQRCEIWKLREPALLGLFRKLDLLKWRLGRRAAKPPVRVDEAGEPQVAGPIAKGLLRLSRRFD